MKLQEYINIDELKVMIDQGYINKIIHPTQNIVMYNYSKICQVDKVWNDTTMKCRGLIVDKDNNIIARPYVKFFNYEEIEDKTTIPENLSYKVLEKIDGSLGILYWYDGKPYITTKGSFTSEQGKHATDLLYKIYEPVLYVFDKNKTYLFEIVYPEDHHCISYGDIDDIILTGIINIDTGKEENINLYDDIFKVAKEYECTDWKNIRNIIDGKNKEGFVVKFSNNYRLKLKFEEYWKIHFLRASLSEKKILNYLIDDDYEILKNIDQLDEENKIMFQNAVAKFQMMYEKIKLVCFQDLLAKNFKEDEDKERAEYYKTCKYPSVLFNMAKNKPYKHIIWKQVKNEYKFSNELENDE